MRERGNRPRAREGRSGEPLQDGPGRQAGIRVPRPRGHKWTGPPKHKSLSRDTRVMPSSWDCRRVSSSKQSYGAGDPRLPRAQVSPFHRKVGLRPEAQRTVGISVSLVRPRESAKTPTAFNYASFSLFLQQVRVDETHFDKITRQGKKPLDP